MGDLSDRVTEEVFNEYKELRDSGNVNMIDENAVQRLASQRGLHNLVVFIEDDEYHELLNNFDRYVEKFDSS